MVVQSIMRFRRAFALASLALLPSVAEAQESVRVKSMEARWQSGVVHVAVQTELGDPCFRMGRPRPLGVVRNTLTVDVPVVRDNAACRGRVAASQASEFHFPSIARTADRVALRLMRDGTAIAHDTAPIRAAVSRR